MNNLTTRKIVLGLLMALVLVFSVQGIADAITIDPSVSTTDVSRTFVVDGPFTSFTITPRVSDVKESVRITTPDGGIQLTAGNIRATSLILTEKNADGTSQPSPPTADGIFFSGSTPLTDPVTISGYFTGLGKRRITITDTTPAKKTAPVYTKTASVTYTFYVVKSVRPTDTISFRLTRGSSRINSQGYVTGVNGRNDFYIYSGSGDYPVTYSVAGGGALYIENLAGEKVAVPGTAISSRIRVWLDANASGIDAENFLEGTTNVVTATIGTHVFKAAYIYKTPTLGIVLEADADVTAYPLVDSPTPLIKDKYEFTGGIAGEDAGTITATVTDGNDTVIPDVVVKFDLADKSERGGYLSSVGTIVSPTNRELMPPPSLARTLYVRTTAGVATVNYEFGTVGKQRITVTTVGLKSKEVTAELASSGVSSKKLAIESNVRQRENSKKYGLIAVVTEDEEPVLSQLVTFRTDLGTLSEISPLATDSEDDPIANTDEEVAVTTNALGEAHVVYDIGDNTGRQEIYASIVDNDDRQSVTFVVNGPAPPPPPPPPGTDADTTTNTVTVVPGSLEGPPGTVAEIAVAADTTTVRVEGSAAFTAAGGTVTGIGAARTVTLPNTAGSYSLTASASSYTDRIVTITVTGTTQLGTLSATSLGGQLVRVTATNSDGTTPAGALVVTLSGASFVTTTAEILGGSGNVAATLPTAQGSYRLTVSATGYGSTSVTLTVGAGTTTTTTTTTRTVAGEADSIEIDGQRRRSGTVNAAARLRVRVLDANDNGVSDVRVTFRVLAPGRGTFSGSRGNGRAVPDQTDRSGYASASLTPSDDGDLIVRASAAGVSADVTFIIDVGEASADPETPAPSEDVAPSRDISPVVHLGVASRPPMLWVDGGAIYALVGASEQRFAPGVDNALNIAIGGGKVYWTEKTGESGGTINSANLNGSGVTELASILAVPMGIAVDAAGSKLYWTNSRGRIQSANLDGSGITNELQNLPSPMDIALARGLVYWTQGNGSVRLVNLTGQRIVRDISTGTDTPGSLVIGGSKVYWTEMTGDSSGTVNSANLNGTGATQLASILAAPSGIAVDTARRKLYWTNSRGRIQSADLDGSKITNVVSGLGSPGELVLSNSITAPTAATTTTTTTASNKYDVNGDGAVDAKDSDVLIIAVAAEITDAKYDVNGDGTVDINDVVAVRANRDPGAAGAPTLVGMKLSAVQIDRLQEQIDLLIATNDRSPAALRTLIYLQQLLVTARPEKTQLLANYPNPFNPETWIPYELATDTDVRLTIYNTQGVVIRTLQFGHQSAGYYVGRDRAAYWDGRNALGEQVASGLYFYQLETDEMSLMRKMVILK